jgi:hypothetical protein
MRKNTADWRNWRRFRGMGRAVFQWVSSHVPCGRRDRPACAAALGPPHRGTIFSLRSCLTIASSPSTSTPTRSRRGGCWERKGEAKAKAEETVTESATVAKRGPTFRRPVDPRESSGSDRGELRVAGHEGGRLRSPRGCPADSVGGRRSPYRKSRTRASRYWLRQEQRYRESRRAPRLERRVRRDRVSGGPQRDRWGDSRRA